MEIDELTQRVLHQKRMEELELKPAAPYDPSEGMTTMEELRGYIRFLYGQYMEEKEQNRQQQAAMQDSLDEMARQLKEANATAKLESDERRKMWQQFEKMTGELKEANDKVLKLTRELQTANERLGVLNSEHFGTSKSLKGSGKNKPTKGKNDGRDDMGGKASVNNGCAQPPSSETDDTSVGQEVKSVYHGPSREGCTYNKQVVGTPIEHRCDLTRLPDGCTVIKKLKPKVVRDLKCVIEEHHFERYKVKYPDGKIRTVYIPCEDDEAAGIYDEIVPGTGVTASLLSWLIFNRYQMATPAYRESKGRLKDMNWDTCRQNLINWADKGAIQLNKLIPALKEVALQEGANVNVDETWCRYQTHFGHRKTYMWCLVNRALGIVIFFYEDTTDGNGVKHEGGRGRNVLLDFLGDAKIKSLQSDGYNVYTYLDGELMDIEHLCCMDHFWAKAKKALNQGCKKAQFFVTEVGKLYRRERFYKEKGLSAERIKEMRNDSYTQGIIDRMKERMEKLLAEGENQVSDLMWRALNYLHDFWDNLFAYRKDGEYAISNCAAEQAIRPQTVQRKNSLFYCSTKGAVNSAIYNTFIETCKQAGISFRDYFRRVILELKHGRTDYANLLPMTIGLKRY